MKLLKYQCNKKMSLTIITVLLLATLSLESFALSDNRRYDRQTLLAINQALINSNLLPTTLPAVDPDLIPRQTTTNTNSSTNHKIRSRKRGKKGGIRSKI